MSYKIHWLGDNSVVVVEGQVTYQQLREIGPAHFGSEKFSDLRYGIIDFTRADLGQVTMDKSKVLASIDSIAVTYKTKLKLAFVVADEYQRTLCERYIEDSAGFRSTWTQGIFPSIEEARTWCEQSD